MRSADGRRTHDSVDINYSRVARMPGFREAHEHGALLSRARLLRLASERDQDSWPRVRRTYEGIFRELQHWRAGTTDELTELALLECEDIYGRPRDPLSYDIQALEFQPIQAAIRNHHQQRILRRIDRGMRLIFGESY